MTVYARPSLAMMLSRPQHVVSLGFGAGLSGWAPGTLGSLMGLPLFLLLAPLPASLEVLAYGVLLLVGTLCVHETGKAFGYYDHNAIVWDETWAMAALLALLPYDPVWWAAAFCLFRTFDIVKPWPVCEADRKVKNAWGVMLDDGLAALYALLLLKLVQWLQALYTPI